MAISAQHIVAFTRHRVSAPSLVCWAALRGGLARLLPALLALWTRLPAFLQFVSVPALESESRRAADPSSALKAAVEDDGEGKVVCEMLYSPPPDLWEVDVIFIHGLHGSTSKTWRQGDWHSKYREVQKVSLRKHPPEADQKEDICARCHLSIRKPKRTMSAPSTCGTTDHNTITDCQSPGKRRRTGQHTSKKCTQNQNIGHSARSDKRKSPSHKVQPKRTHRKRSASNIAKETSDKSNESSDSDDDVLYFNVIEKRDIKCENNYNNLTEDVEEIESKEVKIDYKRVPLELSVNNSCHIAISGKVDNFSKETDKIRVDYTEVGDKETSCGQPTAVPSDLTEESKCSNYTKLDCDASAIICDNSCKRDILIAGNIEHDKDAFVGCDKNNLDLTDTIHPMDSITCDKCARKNTTNNLRSGKCEDCSAIRELGKIDFKETGIELCTKDELLFYIDLDPANGDFSESNSSQGDDYIPVSNCMKRRHDASKVFMTLNLRTEDISMDNDSSKLRKLNDEASETKSLSSNKSSFDEYMELENDFFNVNPEYNQLRFDSSIQSREERIVNEKLDQLTYDFLEQFQYFNDDSDGLDAPYEVSDESYIKTAASEPNFLHGRPKDEMLQDFEDGRIEIINLNDGCSKSDSSVFESGNENDEFSSSDLESGFDRQFINGSCTCGAEKKDEKSAKGDGKLEDMLSSCWPRDWIPIDHPGARVISLSYTTDQYLWRPIWIKPYNRSSLHERSEDMIRQLSAHGAGSRPIVWVGHSKGGLFIKQMFADGYESWSTLGPSSPGARIYLSSRALVFYSVPHRGSPLANIKLPFLLRVSSELEEIQHESEFVLRLHERFLGAVRGGEEPPAILSYSETRRTLMGAIYLRIVPLQSADPGVGSVFGVSLDHREICKPTSRSCFLYRELLGVIQSTARSSP